MKYEIVLTSAFKKCLKIIKKRHKDLDKLTFIVNMIASGEFIPKKYCDHELYNDKHFKNCRELHIESNWLLVYKINKEESILYLVETGSQSDLFEN